jgi:glycosyltransferase involved in cell wall biosynthesis
MLNLGIIVNNLDVTSGGEFNYTKSLIRKLIAHKNDDLCLHYFSNYKDETLKIDDSNINFENLRYNLFRKIYDIIKKNLFKLFRYSKYYNSYLDFFFKKRKIDIAYFVSPNHYSTKIYNTKYITTVWDLNHKEHFEFPEVGHKEIFEQRELLLKNSLNRSSIIITDNNLTKNNIIKHYNVNESRIRIVPFHSDTIKFNENDKFYNNLLLENPFIFYPANFWEHKNHKLLLYVIYELKKNNRFFNLILTGSDRGYLKEIKKKISKLNLEDSVYFLGHLNKNQIIFLYKKAHCVIMPTYFGPSNLPPLEAAKFNCPIVYTYFGDDEYLLPENAYWPLKEFDHKKIAKIIENIDKKKQETITKILNAKKFNDEMNNSDFIKNLISHIYAIELKTEYN